MRRNLFTRILGRYQKAIRKIVGAQCLEDLTAAQRREMWPSARSLEDKHICNCRFVENRNRMLEYMPKNAVCGEVGILTCDFSKIIFETTKPSKLHLIDIDNKAVEIAREKFASEIADKTVAVHQGDSAEIIAGMPENYFDWIYIDGDHSYEGVKRDLDAARLRTKPDGMIAMNDYVFFETSGFSKYGVVEAVNEFCLDYDYEIIYFALQARMYNDVVLRKIL